ncbi:phosphoesterase family-domain-containing protein [Gautieria morchelliformis]|nr:phosphoesterase family-domain-containing protein [Gautieria morchelliformis]
MRFIFNAAVCFCAAANVVLANHSRRDGDPNPGSPELDDSVQAALRALGREELRHPGSLPNPKLPAGTDTLPGIEHIIMLMMENHSFDNMFGLLGRGDGFTLGPDGKPLATNPYPNGSIQHAFHMPNTCQLPSQPSQTWTASHNAFDNGSMDGFVSTPIFQGSTLLVGGVAMGYYIEQDLPTTFSLAKQFPIADRFFCSLLGQTFPNRMYLIAATSLGITEDNQDISQLQPAAGTIFNTLDKFNISWTDYVAQFPNGATPELFLINDNLTEAVNHKSISDFFADAAAGMLPQFSFIDPNNSVEQENPRNVVLGDAFISDITHAIGNSPLWNKTLFIINYDEHGGYFDHVPPPAALRPDSILPINPNEPQFDGYQRYGFRVPMIAISPYAKRDFVSHMVYDHTSVLALLERKFNLPALTFRDANANDLTDFLDFEALAKQTPNFPVMPPLAAPGNTTAALACSVTGPGVIPPPGTVSPPDDHHDH